MSTATNPLLQPYQDPDIPGIFTSVTDESIEQEENNNSRSIFMAFPSKYGKTEITPYFKATQMNAAIGGENTFKYGLGQFYARSFIDAGATVYHKRTEDPTATFANKSLYKTSDGLINPISLAGVRNKDELTTPDPDSTPETEQIKQDTVLSLLAAGRGTGYNDLFVVNKAAKDYEKFEADDEGQVNYKFNFLFGTVYEDGSEVFAKSNSILYSLMDNDPVTKSPITHRTNGVDLYMNKTFRDNNDYVSAEINESFREELQRYPNIQAMCDENNVPRLVVEDYATATQQFLSIDQRRFYEVKIDDSKGTSTLKLIRTVLPRTADATFVGTNDTYRLYAEQINGQITLKAAAANLDVANGEVATFSGDTAYIEGENAFYSFSVDDTDGTPEFKMEIVPFLRWTLYTYLLSYNNQLAAGADDSAVSGVDGYSGSFVKSDGAANIDNIATRISWYLENDKEIQEVVYPRYTYNYIIDWTKDSRIIDNMFVLADRLKRTMHIASCVSVMQDGLTPARDKVNDLTCRETTLIRSSYNTMLYSSQGNKQHNDSTTSLTFDLPASYYAMLAHIKVDNEFGPTEPVANIEKGKLQTDRLKLSNKFYSGDIAELRKLQINTIVVDGADTYFIDQLTAYKRSSKLSLGNVVKALQQLQTDIPVRLKRFLQKKETDTSITVGAINEINQILKPYKVSSRSQDGIFRNVTIKTTFNNNVLTILLRVSPVGTTEKINVPIMVEG